MKRIEAVIGRWPQLTGRKTDPVSLLQFPAPAPQNRCAPLRDWDREGKGGGGVKSGS